MPKYFNTTGPCFPRLHYMLPPKDRLVGVSMETCQEVTAVERAMPAMAAAVRQYAESFGVPVPEYRQEVPAESMLSAVLVDCAR
ncbi:MAG: hypothetical protein D3909_06525, partial [Candidatus Electrothrix sp. ATG1]|nr:hypothetical protein [Candidatus Electrothrix sp. ATG1]